MKNKTKLIAMYLPQFHEIPENNKFWGKGFTDWISVKNAKQVYDGEIQPKIPLNKNYYDLSCVDTIRWQAKLAKEYGIYGFGMYHYWFNNQENLLTKPSEILLQNKDIDINFLFAWDNSSWKRTWSNVKGNDWAPTIDNKSFYGEQSESPYLVEYILGDESDWRKHFEYLIPFFQDARYIRNDDKPVFLIYNYDDKIKTMAEYWNKISKEYGFQGIEIIFLNDRIRQAPKNFYRYCYEPQYSGWGGVLERTIIKVKKMFLKKELILKKYDNIWTNIIKNAYKCTDKKVFYGGFVNFDDTPRRGKKARIVLGGSPEKFKNYLSELIKISSEQQKKYIFLTAWNEWGEGAYLEPDEINKYKYLEAVRDALKENN